MMKQKNANCRASAAKKKKPEKEKESKNIRSAQTSSRELSELKNRKSEQRRIKKKPKASIRAAANRPNEFTRHKCLFFILIFLFVILISHLFLYSFKRRSN